jgi:maltooligosyltrehalose trehalohydrolase
VKTKVEEKSWELELGAHFVKEHTTFRVWAPSHRSVYALCNGEKIPLKKEEKGYFYSDPLVIQPGASYCYVFENGQRRPDPVSRALKSDLHGESVIVDPHAYQWKCQEWKGVSYDDVIFYELHVGTFTQQGDFDGVIEKLPHLKALGITMIELMPLHTFPGRWNWGYDGASLYAPYRGYGGYEGLKRLVDAAHLEGIGVCLDVVYNHLGPDGNYLPEFGPYFSDVYHTPWGKGLNFDGKYSDEVKRFVIENALYWLSEFRLDALRIDAIHGIYDISCEPMLHMLSQKVNELAEAEKREILLVAENARNDAKTVRPHFEGGVGFQGMWNDDFHHALHTVFTGETQHYYQDFDQPVTLKKALSTGLSYDGNYSTFFARSQGNSTKGVPLKRFIVFAQNHDQIGNRAGGERLSKLVGPEFLPLIPYFTLLTPMTPLLFMGEEYGEEAPFEYFVDFPDERLMRSIHQGRIKEFKNREMAYPGEEAFKRTQLNWKKQKSELLKIYSELIQIRKQYPAADVEEIEVGNEGRELFWWKYPLKEGGEMGVYIELNPDLPHAPPFGGKILHQLEGGRALATWLH